MSLARSNFADLPTPSKVAVVVAVIVQVSLTVAGFVDLARRDQDEVRGPKPVWIPVILVNWVGPMVYFLAGRRR
ncbi:PLDc_N domain-containing protein [Planctomonas sp. JC2975]|uniref:PLD nuclease N-terminal domain-containing protein n=1 Tax=Planctomonas sp. JC2975 TaxID=2729626 RepID=UPI001472F72E|nr:PLD nuclease N-terminal domain-containing protein [Planctomonas sp. JC2975]NNC12176.1 PLDc_N domain-containing protein [Planctomonas sp. JC2975]